jgi:hypothetical protein
MEHKPTLQRWRKLNNMRWRGNDSAASDPADAARKRNLRLARQNKRLPTEFLQGRP